MKLKPKERDSFICGKKAGAGGECRSLEQRLKWMRWEGDQCRRQEQMASLKRLLHRMEASTTPPFILDQFELLLSFLQKVCIESQGSLWWAHVPQSRDGSVSHSSGPSFLHHHNLPCRFLSLCLHFILFHFSLHGLWFSPNHFHSLLWNAPSLSNYI